MAFDTSSFSDHIEPVARDAADSDVSRYLQTILLTRPIDQIEYHKNNRMRSIGDKTLLDQLDCRYLALIVLDFIFRQMALSEGVTEVEIRIVIKRHVLRQAGNASEDDLELIADNVFQALRNDDGSKFHFTYRIDTNWYAFDFHLIRAYEGTSEEILFRLTDDAINLLDRSLKYDKASQQEITEILLQKAIEGGQVARARTYAQNALDNSVGYENKVIEILENARRRIGSISWSQHVQPLTSAALDHIGRSLEREHKLLYMVDRSKADVDGDNEVTRELGKLYETIQRCATVHNRLQKRIRDTGTEWRLLQVHAFRQRTAMRLPDFVTQILPRMLSMTVKDLGRGADQIVAAIMPPVINPVFDIATILALVCEPQVEREPDEPPVDGEDEETDLAKPYFPETLQNEVLFWIMQNLPKHPTMSAMLEAATKDGKTALFRELLFYTLETAVHPNAVAGIHPMVRFTDTSFTTDFVRGDDVRYGL